MERKFYRSILIIALTASLTWAAQPYQKMLVVGNSITRHAPAPEIGWFGDWGMAASSQENDYVHLLYNALQSDQPDTTLTLELGQVRGEGAMLVDPPDGTDPWSLLLPTDADLVVIQLGDNYWYTSNLPHLQSQFAAMVADFKNQANNPDVFCISTWGSNANKDAAMRAGAESSGARWISINGLINVEGNQAFDLYDDWGVGWHPSDQGMAAIAAEATAAIRDASPYYFPLRWTQQITGQDMLYGGNTLYGNALIGQTDGGILQWATINQNIIDPCSTDPCTALFDQYTTGAKSAVKIGNFLFYAADGSPSTELGIGRLNLDGTNAQALKNPGNVNPQSLATDGTRLFTDDQVNLGYVHCYSFDPNDPNGFNPTQDWVADTGATDIKAISSYHGNVYAVDAVGGSVYEIDPDGNVTVLGTHLGTGPSQAVRFGDNIFVVGDDGKFWGYPLENGSLGTGSDSDLGLGALYGLTVRGYRGQPVGFWVTSANATISYYGDYQILGGIPGGRFYRNVLPEPFFTGYWSYYTSTNATVNLVSDGGTAPSNYVQMQVAWYPRAANVWYANTYGSTPTNLAWVIKADVRNSNPGGSTQGANRVFSLRTMPEPGIFSETAFSLDFNYVGNWIDWVAGSISGRTSMLLNSNAWTTATIEYDPVTGIASAMFGDQEIFKVATETGLSGNAVYFSNFTSSTRHDTGNFDVDNIVAMLADEPDLGVGPTVQMTAPAIPQNGTFTDNDGLASVQLLWSEPVGFDNARIIVTDSNNDVVSTSVQGINSRVMTINFDQPMLNDTYIIRVKETVIGLVSIAGIDGDNDGQPGGDYVLTLNHKSRADGNADGSVDTVDLSVFAQDWLWTK